jgi:hypothetical protein
MAVAGFKGFGWLLCGVIVSPGLYLVTSQVAAERGRVDAVERSIVQAQRDLRDLETEFQTRANFAQLERWNGDVLALASPRPEQYAGGETALAALNPNGMTAASGDGAGVQQATLLVPSAIQMPEAPQVAQASAVTVPAPAARLQPSKSIVAASAPTPVAPAPRAARRAPKGEAVAMLDRKLLDDSTLGDLLKSARAEAVRRR